MGVDTPITVLNHDFDTFKFLLDYAKNEVFHDFLACDALSGLPMNNSIKHFLFMAFHIPRSFCVNAFKVLAIAVRRFLPSLDNN